MRYNKVILVLLSLYLIASCNKQDIDPPIIDDQPVISEFSFLRQQNPGLVVNIILEEEDNVFTGTLPEGARIRELIAFYTLKDGYQAFVDEELQVPGESINDFSKQVNYTIVGSEGDTSLYKVALEFIQQLPIINIFTENAAPIVSKDDYINATVTIDGKGIFPDVQSDIEIRGRGNSTWGIHPKKPYQIKFPDKTSVLGMPEDKRWLLLAEYSDKTFIRNKFAFEMGYLSNLDWTPLSEYAEVYLNGYYNGLYNISQKVEESKNRVNITNDGYLLEIDHPDRLDPDDVYFYCDHFLLNIKEPDLESHGPESEYIKSYIADFEDALFGPDFKNLTTGYKKYIDMESVADWFLINEIAKNVDAKSFSSIFMYLKPGDRLKMGPIWDFDLGYGNVNYADPQYPENWWVKENAWITRMLEDPAFVVLVKQRYAFFRDKQYQLFEKMDEYIDYIYPAILANDKKWHTIGVWVWPNPVVYDSYELELSYMKGWVTQRFAWMDGAIQQL